MRDKMSEANHHIIILDNKIAPAADRILTREKNRLTQISLRLKALDPKLLLKRGYSITLHNGKAVHNAAELKAGDEIETRLEKGTLTSIIK